jgi:RNA polymerase sporulation-specific sigma factor
MPPRPPPIQGEEEPSPPAPSPSARTLPPERIELVERYAPLCKSLSKGYRRAIPAHAEDFLSAAYLGLVIAARDFDPSRGVKFSSYAWKCIQGYLRTEWTKLRPLGYRGTKAPPPTTEPLLEDSASSSRNERAAQAREEIAELIDVLPDREAEVLRAIYQDGQSQSDVARQRGCSRAYVNKIHQSALTRLNDVARLRAGKFSSPSSLEKPRKPPCDLP